ncbi:MAG: hypothetical protein PF508_00405, partial [Spirochaeta sp.]|nr:hypothetical protein [Spirochaeta sp.]
MSDTRRPRILMILNNAPDYREPFLRELSREVDLMVVARPCEPDGLVAPAERIGYSYVEIPARRGLGVVWQPGLGEVVTAGEWDVICSSINMRDIGRIRLFRRTPQLHDRWVWWGHIFGKTPLPGLARLRRSLLLRSAGALVFSDVIATEVRERYGIPVKSFNNTQVLKADFRAPVYLSDGADDHPDLGAVRLLFVGRYQPRKRLERLVALAGRRQDVQVRLVGPGMDALTIPEELKRSGGVATFGRTVGDALNGHFDWADLVANPGHVGLLVMNTAQHGKGIVVDSSSDHAPEYWL